MRVSLLFGVYLVLQKTFYRRFAITVIDLAAPPYAASFFSVKQLFSAGMAKHPFSWRLSERVFSPYRDLTENVFQNLVYPQKWQFKMMSYGMKWDELATLFPDPAGA